MNDESFRSPSSPRTRGSGICRRKSMDSRMRRNDGKDIRGVTEDIRGITHFRKTQ